MMIDIKLRHHIDVLMLNQAQMITKEIDKISTSFQEEIVVLELSNHMKAIIKTWSRVSPLNAKEKLNHAIKRTVELEIKLIVFECLVELYEDLLDEKEDRLLDASDVSHALEHTCVCLDLTYLNWNMADKLENEALRIIMRDGDTLLLTDYLPVSRYDAETKTFLFEQAYNDECEEYGVHLMTPKVLPSYFKHPDDWTCVICLSEDAVVPTCVVTMCAHVYHKSCLLSWKSKCTLKKDNKDKTCFSCPSCRTNVCME